MDNQPNQGQNQENSDNQSFSQPIKKEAYLRTMDSDTKSIERGDPSPMPETVVPKEYDSEPSFKPETQSANIESEINSIKESKSKKGLIITILVLVLAVGLGVGYYVFFMGKNETIQPPPSVITPPPPISKTHTSLFLINPAAASEIRLNNLLQLSIMNALRGLSLNTTLPQGSVQEVAILDDLGNQTDFSSYLTAFVPVLSATDLSQWFEEDFTAFLYYDADGSWPGYVAKIKSGVNLDTLKTTLLVMESTDLNKFYFNLGNFGEFKDGQVNDKPSRYSSGENPGAAFNYMFNGNYFIISTSYNGLRSVIPLLGI